MKRTGVSPLCAYKIMDTRSKILSSSEAARIALRATVVSGYFDPLLAWHASRLQELKAELKGNSLLALIATPPNPILSASARAELVAGLKVVDYVCEAPEEIAPHFCLEDEERGKIRELIDRVHSRHVS
jgi:hypothetical protein